MRIIILGGFLGSGKTSLLLQMARYLTESASCGIEQRVRVMILENEIGEVGVDDQLLRGNGYRVENLFSGCACCSMAGEVVANANRIQRDFSPDWLILESTGVAYPKLIRDNLEQGLGISAHIFAVVDAKRWKRLLVPMKPLLSGQLADAEAIFLNKTDLVTPEILAETEKSVRLQNSSAKLFPVSAVSELPIEIWHQLFEEAAQ